MLAGCPTHRHGLRVSRQAIPLIARPCPGRSPRGHSRHATMRHGSHPGAPRLASQSSLRRQNILSQRFAPVRRIRNRRARHSRHQIQRSAANSRSLTPRIARQECRPMHAAPIPARSYPPPLWLGQAGCKLPSEHKPHGAAGCLPCCPFQKRLAVSCVETCYPLHDTVRRSVSHANAPATFLNTHQILRDPGLVEECEATPNLPRAQHRCSAPRETPWRVRSRARLTPLRRNERVEMRPMIAYRTRGAHKRFDHGRSASRYSPRGPRDTPTGVAKRGRGSSMPVL